MAMSRWLSAGVRPPKIPPATNGYKVHKGVSKNGGTPKWMVYKGKPYEQMDDLGGNPLFSETFIREMGKKIDGKKKFCTFDPGRFILPKTPAFIGKKNDGNKKFSTIFWFHEFDFLFSPGKLKNGKWGMFAMFVFFNVPWRIHGMKTYILHPWRVGFYGKCSR